MTGFRLSCRGGKRVKAITLWQPWASLVAVGAKKIETRSWATAYRGPLAIHAAKKKPADFVTEFMSLLKEQGLVSVKPAKIRKSRNGIQIDVTMPRQVINAPSGVVLCTCNLVDCLEILNRTSIDKKIVAAQLSDGREITGNELRFGDYFPGRYAWILENVKWLPEPMPAKGKQGLWNWEPPEESSHER